MTLPHAEVLHDALQRFDLDTIAPEHTGRTFEQAWTDGFAVLAAPAPREAADVIYAQLGADFAVGRHRSGPDLVWHDPRLDLALATAGQWSALHPDDKWDGERHLAVTFTARNGSTDAAAADLALREHPQFLYAQDGPGALVHYMFSIDATDELCDAVYPERFERRRRDAEWMLGQIKEGIHGPWVVFAPNPSTQDALGSAGAIYARWDARLQAGEVAYGRQRLALADVETAIEYLSWQHDDVPSPNPQAWRWTMLDRLLDWRTKADEYAAGADDLERTLADADSGTLPEYVVRTLRAQVRDTQLPYLQSQARSYARNAAREAARLAADRDILLNYLTKVEDAARAKAHRDHLQWALRWPADPASCPPKPARATSESEPF